MDCSHLGLNTERLADGYLILEERPESRGSALLGVDHDDNRSQSTRSEGLDNFPTDLLGILKVWRKSPFQNSV